MQRTVFSHIRKIIICAAIIFLIFWFYLPPLNPMCPQFWIFLIMCTVVCGAVYFLGSVIGFFKNNTQNGRLAPPDLSIKGMTKPAKIFIIAILAVIALMLLASVIGWQMFNAGSYNKLLTLNNSDFAHDISEIGQEQIPVVDRDTASRLGQRKLGEMSDLVSQFEIMDIYTQINYKGKPVRVTPLIYGDVIKWFNNQSEGVPAYIMVDMTSQEVELKRLTNGGIKYSTGEYLMRNVERYLRFNYPTKIFDNISFEIDDNGTPYWVVSTVDYRIGIWSGKDIGGAILLNAQTGESAYYELDKVPTWVDQVFDEELVLEQLTYNGKYRSGYFNSIFGQKGVLQPTDGYNYLAINDDVYLYTGMTSVTSDESNVGFVLINLRTKQAAYYECPGAEEYSAMNSAEGQVQHLGYTSTFPLLLNISDRPTYFMSLKDAAGLVKMYAFVDVKQYQIVGTGNTVDAARKDYLSKLKDEKVEAENAEREIEEGIIADISSAVIEGNTNYFIKLTDESICTVPITMSNELAFARVGDKLIMTYEVTKTERTLVQVEVAAGNS